jgi:predicted XRE-type DNA-binding protein
MNKNDNQSYQYPARDKEILAKMKHFDYEGNLILSPDASALEKTKYKVCKKILGYKQDNNLTIEELAKRINLSTPETKELLFCHIHKFTMDRLVSYASHLFDPLEVDFTKAVPKRYAVPSSN